MKLFFFLLLLSVLTGCSSLLERAPEAPEAASGKMVPAKDNTQKSGVTPTRAVWDLLNQEEATLFFRNVDDGTYLTVIINKGMNLKDIDKGHWELSGFALGSTSYRSMNTSRKFVFKAKAKENVYAGSIVIGCPEVSGSNFRHLKTMRFFNRYPFSSEKNICEMVIGNDLARIRKQLKKSRKYSNLPLVNGF